MCCTIWSSTQNTRACCAHPSVSQCLFLLFQALCRSTYLILLATPSPSIFQALTPLALGAKCLVGSLVQLVTPAELTPAVAAVHAGFQDWLPTKVVHPRKLALLIELVWGSEFAGLRDKQSIDLSQFISRSVYPIIVYKHIQIYTVQTSKHPRDSNRFKKSCLLLPSAVPCLDSSPASKVAASPRASQTVR